MPSELPQAAPTGFPVMSVGTGSALDDDEGAAPEEMGARGPAGGVVDVVVLVPTERSHAAKVDPVVEELVARLVAARRPVVLLGVAPAYPMAVRMIPGGVAKKNREDDATTLDRRCSAIRDAVCGEGGSAISTARVTVHVVAHGNHDIGTMAVQGATAAARACAEAAGRDPKSVRVGLVAVPPDSTTLVGITNAEAVVRAVLAARLADDVAGPFAAFTTKTTSAEILRDPAAKGLPQGRRTRPSVAVCIIDTDALGQFPPPHVAAVLARTLDGDQVVLFAPVPMPEAGEAMQLSSTDWSGELKEREASAQRILADHVAAAKRVLAARGRKDVDVRGVTSGKHYMQAVADAVKGFTPRCVALAEDFKRQRVLQTMWESVRGVEYERIARGNPATGFLVA